MDPTNNTNANNPNNRSSEEDLRIKNARQKTMIKLNIYHYTALIICVAYIIQDIFTRDEFFDKSNEVTLHVMENTGKGYEWFNRRISTLSMVGDALMIAYVFWITPRQIDGLYLIICTALSLFQMTFIKSLYRDPRPYFVNLDIKTDECGPEYGNPSGHGVNNLVMVYVSHYIADNDCFRMFLKNAEGKIVIHQRRFWINIIGLILCILIGWARVCLGMHSLNQVLLGWVLGIIWIIVYLSVFYKRYRFYWSDVMKEVGFTYRKKRLLIILVLVYLFMTGMCVLVYEMNNQHFDIPEMWIKGIIQTCKQEFDDKMFYRSLYHKTFTDMGVYGVTFGVMLGMLFMTGNYNEKKLQENYSKATKKFILLRVVSDIILLAIFFGIPWISVQFTAQKHVYPRFFIAFNLASFLAGLALVLLRAKFFKFFKCQLEGDLNSGIINEQNKTILLIEDVQTDYNTNDNSNQQLTPLKDKIILSQDDSNKIQNSSDNYTSSNKKDEKYSSNNNINNNNNNNNNNNLELIQIQSSDIKVSNEPPNKQY